jgi:hypothetical protein
MADFGDANGYWLYVVYDYFRNEKAVFTNENDTQ